MTDSYASNQKVFGAVAYYNDSVLALYFDKATRDMASLAQEMADNFRGWENFPAIFAEYEKDLLETASDHSKKFMIARCALVLDKFKNVDETQAAEPLKHLLKTIRYYQTQVDKLKFSNTPVPADGAVDL